MTFASKLTKTVEIPGDEPGTVTIRKLSHYQLMMARDRAQDRVIERANKVGAVLHDVIDKRRKEQENERRAASYTTAEDDAGDAEAEREARRAGFDQATVLQAGIVSWSFAEPADEASINDLDEETAQLLFDAILSLSLRTSSEKKGSDNGSTHTLTDTAASPPISPTSSSWSG